MRFYLLRLTAPSVGNPSPAPNGPLQVIVNMVQPKEWTSHPNGIYDPAAHNIHFDFQVVDYANYAGAMVITIEGPQMDDLIQAANYTPFKSGINNDLAAWRLELYGGMSPDGLPLSTPAAGQPMPGLLAVGEVLEAFGNWTGTDMRLSFLVVPAGVNQRPLDLNWTPGEPLAQALQTMLNYSFPGIPQSIQITPNLVGPPHGIGHYTTSLRGMAHFLLDQTQGPNYGMAANYPGVSLYVQNGIIIATDSTQMASMTTTQLSEESFIGQPVWIGGDTMAMNLVMRSDMRVGNYVEMPKGFSNVPGFVTTLASINNYNFNFKLSFSGKFIIKAVRHIGEFRGTSGEDWMTTVEAVPLLN